MRRIIALTGTRADYGRSIDTWKALQADRGLDFGVLATGMHLSEQYGMTIREVETEFPVVARVPASTREDTRGAMSRAMGIAIIGITEELERLQPDILLLLGDRGEMLAGAIAGAHLDIHLAHIAGGDVTGSIDNSLRHAITKLAHIHLTATQVQARRVIQMGEDPSNVYVVGATDVDRLIRIRDDLQTTAIVQSYGLQPDAYLLLVQHSVTQEAEDSGVQIAATFNALRMHDRPVVAVRPNSDAGNKAINGMIDYYADEGWLRCFTSLPYYDYLALLKHCCVLVGNSSSGLMEAPTFRIPAVNIGSRQAGRLRGSNVIDTDYNCSHIKKAIILALDPAFRCGLDGSNPYGDGQAGFRIASILKRVELGQITLSKGFNDRHYF